MTTPPRRQGTGVNDQVIFTINDFKMILIK
jgi:hypothetical protein